MAGGGSCLVHLVREERRGECLKGQRRLIAIGVVVMRQKEQVCDRSSEKSSQL